MGKPTGFLEFEREPPHARPPLERIGDWSGEHPAFDEETLRRQGGRCMDCGVPFCQTGTLIGGVASGCPIHNVIPDWNDLVWRGQWREASLRLHATNDFPEITGRVCPAPCEGSCTLGINDQPVAIKTIELAIAERAWSSGWVRPEPPPTRSGRRVAVIGSGPAGLACAAQLNGAGHEVTVFERAERAGGLLVYGIPNMKLDKAIVERRVRLLADSGVRFVTGVEVGRDVPGAHLAADFDATVICTGATVPRELAVPGRELAGVQLALDFLGASTRALLAMNGGEASISAEGRQVVVIGGGDTGTDCVATAIRQRARKVSQLEILARPPDARAADNPWPQWPRVYRLDYGQEEAAALWGADPRRYSVQTKRFVGDAQGRLSAIETVEVEWLRAPDGRLRGPRELEGTATTVPADLALLALGFLGPEQALPDEFGCEVDERGTIATDADKMTSVPGIFAAGDCSRGQSLVVWAIQEGRAAARGVDRFLMPGETVLSG